MLLVFTDDDIDFRAGYQPDVSRVSSVSLKVSLWLLSGSYLRNSTAVGFLGIIARDAIVVVGGLNSEVSGIWCCDGMKLWRDRVSSNLRHDFESARRSWWRDLSCSVVFFQLRMEEGEVGERKGLFTSSGLSPPRSLPSIRHKLPTLAQIGIALPHTL